MDKFSVSRSVEYSRLALARHHSSVGTMLNRVGWAAMIQIIAMVMIPLVALIYTIRASADIAPVGRNDDPAVVVRATTERLQALLDQRRAAYRADRHLFHAAVDEIVSPHFDMEYASQLVLARTWRAASEEQRTRFRDAFKSRLIDLYGDALLDQTAAYQLRWLQTTKSGDGTLAVVHANVLREDGPPVQLGFATRQGSDGAWRVYDITLDAISLVTSFRSQYAAAIRNQGLDGLLRQLEGSDVASSSPVAQAQR